jgi:hypothetical protein
MGLNPIQLDQDQTSGHSTTLRPDSVNKSTKSNRITVYSKGREDLRLYEATLADGCDHRDFANT